MIRSRNATSSEEKTDFNQIFADHHDRIYRIILNQVRDPAEAEDLTQETLINAYRGLSNFRGQASLGTWILRIARNVVLDRYRYGARRVDDSALSLDDLEPGDLTDAASLTPAQATERRLSDECIRNHIQTLPEPHRQAVELHDLQGLKNPEVAEVLGLSLATVKMRVHRGRQQLQATCKRGCEVYPDERNEPACQPRRTTTA